MKKSTHTIIVFFAYWVVFIAPSTANCCLGDTLDQAKMKAPLYKDKYGAVDPLFNTNANGKVIWECWAAPPQMWSKYEALEFAKQLIPSSIRKETPQEGEKDGGYEPFIYSDGTIIILTNGFGGKYIGVEVRAPNLMDYVVDPKQ